MNSKNDRHKEPAHELRDFVANCQTLILATVSTGGLPNSSYAPFVESDGCFFILISGLAKHTSNLLNTGLCHAMLIADEKETTNPFARKRVSYSCQTEAMDRNDPNSKAILTKLEERFGPTIGTLAELPDFQLIRLIPGEGVWVRGFAQAIPVLGLPKT